MCEAGGVKQVGRRGDEVGLGLLGARESISAGIEIGLLCRWEVRTCGMVSVRVCRFCNFKLRRNPSLWHQCGLHLRV
jgi:hypothetical protein